METRHDDEIDLYDIYRVLREDWAWIVGITGLFAVITVVVSLLATEIYRAEVVVSPVEGGAGGRGAMLAQQFGGLAGLAGVDLGGLSGDGNRIARPYLQSRALVEEFITRNDLLPMLFEKIESDEPPTLWLATKRFMEDVRTVEMDDAGLIRVSVEWPDPEIAAEWANGLVALANEKLRQRELAEAERNIAYLNEQIDETSVVGLRQAMFNLVENEMQTVMLANAREEYAFAVIDPAVVPEQRSSPKRKLMVILGTMLGGFVSLLFVGFRRLYIALKAREAAEVR